MWIWNSKLPGRPWVRALHSSVQQIYTRLLGTGGATPVVTPVNIITFVLYAQPAIHFTASAQTGIAWNLTVSE